MQFTPLSRIEFPLPSPEKLQGQGGKPPGNVGPWEQWWSCRVLSPTLHSGLSPTWVSSSVTSRFSLFRCLFTKVMSV